MGGLGGMRKYLYWSEARVQAVAAEYGIRIGRDASVPGSRAPRRDDRLLGEYESRRHDRNDDALKLEVAIGSEAVWDFTGSHPARYAKGRGTVVFSELAYEIEDPTTGVAFTCTVASNGCRVAVCLFGSIACFADVMTDVTPQARGWSATSTRLVRDFLINRGVPGDRYGNELPALAGQALRIATRQGEERVGDEVRERPWQRGFAYGHLREIGEWFAEVYADVPMSDLARLGVSDDAYDRVLVGAPLWIRTPSLRALTLYDEIPGQELDLDIGWYE